MSRDRIIGVAQWPPTPGRPLYEPMDIDREAFLQTEPTRRIRMMHDSAARALRIRTEFLHDGCWEPGLDAEGDAIEIEVDDERAGELLALLQCIARGDERCTALGVRGFVSCCALPLLHTGSCRSRV